MNQDHHMALVDYVVVYGKIPRGHFQENSVKIVQVDDTRLTLLYDTADTKANNLGLIWNETVENENLHVTAISDVKGKLIAMAKYAAEKQGLAHKRLTKVLPPKKPSQLVFYVLAALLFSSSVDPTWLRSAISKNSWLSALTSAAPAALKSLAVWTETKIRIITAATYAIHLVEIFVVSWPKLTKYRTSFFKKLVWAAMHFIEGFAIFERLDEAIEKS